MVVGGTVVAVKIAIALGAATIVTKLWEAMKGRNKPGALPAAADPVEPQREA
ncbi:hypothetical protein D3C86_2054720 [compost metagenome]